MADAVCCAAKRLKSSKTKFAERAFPDVRCIESLSIGLWVALSSPVYANVLGIFLG